MKGDEKRTMAKAEKNQLVSPLASIFIKEGIVVIRDGAKLNHLTRNDINKDIYIYIYTHTYS